MDHVISYAKDENKTKIEFNQKYEMLVDDLQNVIDYARNSDKTEKEYFVTGINCDSDSAYEEGKVNLEAIKFITNEYAKAENLKPALQLVNTCIAVHGESEELEKARNIVLGLYKKQAIRMCLKQGFTVEETMARAGASENEVREINRQYTQGVEQSDKNTTKKADVER